MQVAGVGETYVFIADNVKPRLHCHRERLGRIGAAVEKVAPVRGSDCICPGLVGDNINPVAFVHHSGVHTRCWGHGPFISCRAKHRQGVYSHLAHAKLRGSFYGYTVVYYGYADGHKRWAHLHTAQYTVEPYHPVAVVWMVPLDSWSLRILAGNDCAAVDIPIIVVAGRLHGFVFHYIAFAHRTVAVELESLAIDDFN